MYPAPQAHPFLFQVSGAVLVSGLIQVVLGVSGVYGWAVRHCGPMVLAPSLSIIGLSAYKEAAFFCSTNWGVALLYVSPGTVLVRGSGPFFHQRDRDGAPPQCMVHIWGPITDCDAVW